MSNLREFRHPRRDRAELLASLPREPERGTCWFCKDEVDWADLIAGYDTWDEQRLACSNCDGRMKHEDRTRFPYAPAKPSLGHYLDPLDVIEWHPASVGRRRHAPRFHARHVVFVALIGFLLGVVIRGMVG